MQTGAHTHRHRRAVNTCTHRIFMHTHSQGGLFTYVNKLFT